MKKLAISIILAIYAVNGATAQTFDLKSALSSLFSSDKLTVEKMAGDWAYSSPAVSFKSSNLLKKAGGAAASSAVESKLAPYYKTAGLEKMTLTIAADSTFTMKLGRTTLKGTISTVQSESSEANFVFNFKVGGKLPIGKMDAYVTATGANTLSITFDVTKLVAIIEKAGSITGNSTIQGISTLLNGYDGICAGFRLTRR